MSVQLSLSAVRNTCFALLSAIETDVRDTIALAYLEAGRADFLPTDVRERALGRFSQDSRSVVTISPVEDFDLLAYTDFGDLSKILHGASGFLDTASGAAVSVVAPKLEGLAAARNRVCHSRPLEEEDFASFIDLAKFLRREASSWDWRELIQVTSKIEADPSYVLRLQIPEFWRSSEIEVPNNLPLPDFDETSFLGRVSERRDLKKHLIGRHPVVTLVGEGGVGKTALALQCVYDLLDLGEHCPFEAIVWVSLKTRVLTSVGVEDVRGAVVDVLGILQSSIDALGSPTDRWTDPVTASAELLLYMSQIKVLLVVDNFETLGGNPFRGLLSEIPEGSKVLITSRVGLGELEIRYPLDTLDAKTAASLLRKYANAFNLSLLGSASSVKLDRYTGFLFRSPLLIKWFVQSVASGADPERIAGRSSEQFAVALKFCFENLFELLSPAEKEVLHILAASRRQLTFTELMFLIQGLSNSSMIEIESALMTLHSSSMVKRLAPDSRGADHSTRLNLTDVASEYLTKFAPPSARTMQKVQEILKKLRESTELSSVQTTIYKYDLFAVRANTKDERICAVYLNHALKALKKRDFPEAKVQVERVLQVLPTYSEAYRVSSFIAAAQGDLYGAAEDLDRALEHSPTSSITCYQYAQLLLQQLDDAGAALEKIDLALQADPSDETPRTLKALCLVRLGRAREAAQVYEDLLNTIDNRSRKWRITTRDQASECYRRWAEQDSKMLEFGKAKEHLSRALAILEDAIEGNDFDDRMGRLYADVIEDLLFLAKSTSDESLAEQTLHKYADASQAVTLPGFKRFSKEFLDQAFSGDPYITNALAQATKLPRAAAQLQPIGLLANGSSSGRVKQPLRESYGFIIAGDQEFFFHRSDLEDPSRWAGLSPGDAVTFEETLDSKGRSRATRVRTAH